MDAVTTYSLMEMMEKSIARGLRRGWDPALPQQHGAAVGAGACRYRRAVNQSCKFCGTACIQRSWRNSCWAGDIFKANIVIRVVLLFSSFSIIDLKEETAYKICKGKPIFCVWSHICRSSKKKTNSFILGTVLHFSHACSKTWLWSSLGHLEG